MARKIRYTRKDLKGPDEFVSTLGKTTSWISANRYRVLAGCGVLLFLAGGIFGTLAWSRWQERKATQDLWPHLNRAREFLLAPAQADEEKLARLEQFLTAHVNMHPDTRAAEYARYYLGSIAFLRQNYDLSAHQFGQAIAAEKEADGLMPYLLRLGLAQALEGKGDPASAGAYAEAAARAPGTETRVQAQLGQARSLAAAGRGPEAVAVYRTILQENPETPYRGLVEIQIARAG